MINSNGVIRYFFIIRNFGIVEIICDRSQVVSFFLHIYMIIFLILLIILIIDKEEAMIMINSIFLNLRKNLSKTIILFVTMLIICNLIIAGFSLLNGWQDMLAKINTTYKNNVVITSAISKFNDTSLNITIDMMDSFKNLDYVDKYNYNIATVASCDQLLSAQKSVTIDANLDMSVLQDFNDGNNTLLSGRLLTSDDNGKGYCMVDDDFADCNNLTIDDTLTVYTNISGNTFTADLMIVGIYQGNDNNNLIYTDLNTGQLLTNNNSNLTSAIFYLDSASHIKNFINLINQTTDNDTNTLTVYSQMYQSNLNNLKNLGHLVNSFLIAMIIISMIVISLVIVYLIKKNAYKLKIYFSLGVSKIRLLMIQSIELLLISSIALTVSLFSGNVLAQAIGSSLNIQDNHIALMNLPDVIEDSRQSLNSSTYIIADYDQATINEINISLDGQSLVEVILVILIIVIVAMLVFGIFLMTFAYEKMLI